MKKDPLSSIDTERAIISIIVSTRGEALDNIRLPDEAFTTVQTREPYIACQKLYGRGVSIDPPALIAELGDTYGRIGKTQFEELISYVPIENANLYANILKDKMMLRRMRDVAQKIEREVVVDGVKASEILGKANIELAAVDADADSENLAPVLWDKVDKEIVDMINGEIPPYIRTFIPWMDKAFGGLYPGEYLGIASRPGLGKTALMEAIIQNLTTNEYNPVPTLVFERDMSPKQLIIRLACRAATVPFHMYHRRTLNPGQMDRLRKAIALYRKVPLIVKSPAGMNVDTMIAEIRREVRVNKVETVFLDHIQSLGSNEKEMRVELTRASMALRSCCTDYNIALTVLAHINRTGKDKPSENDIKEFDQLLGDVDGLMMLWRDHEKDDPEMADDPNTPKAAMATVGKCRSGGKFDIPLWWHGPAMSFTERVVSEE